MKPGLLTLDTDSTTAPPTRCIVRLSTSAWTDSRGAIHLHKKLSTLRRQSTGHDFIAEDANNIGAAQVLENIINLTTCDDGVYEVVMCNERTDWETGVIDDYDYKLVPVNAVVKPQAR